MEELITLMGQISRAVSILVQRADIAETDAAEISAFYPLWKPVAYGNNQWVRWGLDSSDKWQLWTTTRNVAAGGTPPDVTPGSWKLIG